VTCFGNIHVLVMRLLLERCAIQKISSFWNIEQKLVACTLLQKKLHVDLGMPMSTHYHYHGEHIIEFGLLFWYWEIPKQH
jgi:hypothetical protein